MRVYGFVIALLAGFATTASPALAVNQTVTVSNNFFSPSTVAVTQGDSVTWNNPSGGGFHNVKFDDGSYTQPPSAQFGPWSVSRTFNNTGSFKYYCEIHGMPGGVGMSGTVNVNALGYARPLSATPLTVKLVPSFEPCAASNSTHGAPLAFAACNPPKQTSDYATVGTPDANGAMANSSGLLKLTVGGESPINPNNGNQADVSVVESITDVRNKSAPATDYAGQLRTVLTFRITDRRNGPSVGDSATATDFAFAFAVPCPTNGDPSIGSNCNVTTSINSQLAGMVLEAKRSVFELRSVQVFDGGADGVASTTGDNTLFETQGFFAP
jgi:plastocyanin